MKNMDRRQFLRKCAAVAGGFTLANSAIASAGVVVSNKALDVRTPKKGPNVVLILADDLGYADIGCYQNPADPNYIDTNVLDFSANIDALAADGVRFTDFQAYPVCTPTRFALLSGMYLRRSNDLWHIGVLHNTDTSKGIDRHTIAEAFKEKGYTTACIGKWHLGTGLMLPNGYPPTPPFSTINNYHPHQKGFDYYYGLLCGSIDYNNHSVKEAFFDWFEERNMLWIDDGAGNNTHPDENKYSTHLITQKAVNFINEKAGKPFFLYVPYNAPHWAQTKIQDSLHVHQLPIEEETPGHPDYRKYLSKFDGYNDGTTTWGPADDNTNWRKRFLAMVNIMDEGIGQIMQALRDKGLEENTIIAFISDNGGETHYDYGAPVDFGSNNYPLRDDKGGVYEGGVRVPAVIKWKNHIPASRTSNQFASVIDMKLTLGRLAGLNMDAYPTDGIDLGPNITNPAVTIDRPQGLFLYHSSKCILRKTQAGDKWKYVKHANGTEALYNLTNDIHEDADLKTSNVTKFNELKNEYWDKYSNQITPGSTPPLP